MQLDINQLRELLATLDQTSISELILKGVDFELTVRKGADFAKVVPEANVRSVPLTDTDSVSANLPNIGSPGPIAPAPSPDSGSVALPVAGKPAPISKAMSTGVDPKWVEVTSPMVGTFYRAPAPGEKAFVEIGDRIAIGNTVCIIEAMKLMNEIESEVSGQVMEILVQNGQPVEYGQRLLWINPN